MFESSHLILVSCRPFTSAVSAGLFAAMSPPRAPMVAIGPRMENTPFATASAGRLEAERAEALLVFLHHAVQQAGQALRHGRAENDAVRELDRGLLRIPRPVDAEERHHLLARAAQGADVGVRAFHGRIVPPDARAARRFSGRGL